MDRVFDVATVLEVLEHIPPESLQEFIAGVAGAVRSKGHVIITVPHRNAKLEAKHYQHFDSVILRDLLADKFCGSFCIPFDYISLSMKLFLKLMGVAGQFYIITHKKLNSLLYRYYINHCLHGKGEQRSHRIMVVATRK